MSNVINESLRSAKQMLDSANESAAHIAQSAERAVDSAKDGAVNATTTARATLLDGVKAVVGVIAMMRSLRADDALRWVGLQQRRSSLGSLGAFGAGLAIGAGAGVLFAPATGSETRRALGKYVGLKSFMQRAESEMKKVESTAKDAGNKAKDGAHKAVDAMESARDGVANRTEHAASALKDIIDAPKHSYTSPATDRTGREANKPTTTSTIGNGHGPSRSS